MLPKTSALLNHEFLPTKPAKQTKGNSERKVVTFPSRLTVDEALPAVSCFECFVGQFSGEN